MPRTVYLLLCSLLCVTAETAHAQQAFINAQNQFALKLYQQIDNDSSNVFISPMSINIALALAMEGSAGETREELLTVLGLRSIENVSWSYRSLIPRHQREARWRGREETQFRINGLVVDGMTENRSYLSISNALWYNTKFSILPEYLAKAQSDYDADAFGYSDADIGTIQGKVDTWVSERTYGKIPSVPASIDERTGVVILNATYMMAPWAERFDRELTEEREFTSIDHSSKDIDFMYSRRLMNYYEDDDIQAVFLPYTSGDTPLLMLIILPDDTYGLPDIEKKLDTAYYNTIFHSRIYADVKLYMPKYRIESEVHLAESLRRLGVNRAFSPAADFSLMSPTGKFFFSDVVHKTFIGVDEEKTEAAAVTVGPLDPGAPAPGSIPVRKVDIDHPFLFLILNDRTGEIVFMGKYVQAQ